MRVLLHDYGAYPFSVELAEVLSARHFEVTYAYCDSLVGTPSGWSGADGCKANPISLSKPLRRERFVERWRLEREYGEQLANLITDNKPDVVLMANTPIDALHAAMRTAAAHDVPVIVWVQDLLGAAIAQVMRQKFGVLGAPAAWWYERRELACFRAAAHLITISESFAPYFERVGLGAESIRVIPNWAPLEQISPQPKSNVWSRSKGLSQTFNFVYSGTLGFKHRPELLLELCLAFEKESDVRVVVNSAGAVASWLQQESESKGVKNLVINPFQPIEQLPNVLATADVLIGMLDTDAATYCVPSKILSNHCAGRAQLLSIRSDNLAAKMVTENNSGLVADPDKPYTFVEAAWALYRDRKALEEMSGRARETAARLFNVEVIADEFQSLIESVAAR